VRDLDEMADTLELFAAGRRPTSPAGAGGIASVHDSGAERALVADLAATVGVRFASIGDATRARLATVLDPGLEPTNPLDVWSTGSQTEELFRQSMLALADDDEVAVVALAVDLVTEYDGDDSYPDAVLKVASSTDKPVVVLSNLGSAVDEPTATRIRAGGVPVLEGTRSGLLALRHLLQRRRSWTPPAAPVIDGIRQKRWRDRLARDPLTGAEGFALLADYGIPVVGTHPVSSAAEAVEAADTLGYPVVLKTDNPAVAHKSDVGGVVLGVGDAPSVAAAYDDLARRLGRRVLVSSTEAEGVELALGLVHDRQLGPLVVVGAGGVLVEVLADRAVRLPTLDEAGALRALDGLRIAPLLDGLRGKAAADRPSVARAVVALSLLAVEIGDAIEALDVNPLRCGLAGCTALDVLVVSRSAAAP
jgi:acyl-CoA synthetase (NDP forming)